MIVVGRRVIEMTILKCHECDKRCSPEFQLQGFILRGLVECPECFEKRSNEINRLRKELKEAEMETDYFYQLHSTGTYIGKESD